MTNSIEPSAPLPRHRVELEGRVTARGLGNVGPLSLMQQRMWFVEQSVSSDAKASFNLCSAQRLSGSLNRVALSEAVRALVHRHPALRTAISHDAHGQPLQCVQAVPLGDLISFEDLSSMGEADRQTVLEEKLIEQRSRPFDLASGRSHRFALFKLASSEHVLVCVIHHLFSDGWSMFVISQDLSELYAAACEARPDRLPTLPITSLDHAAWQIDWLTQADAQRELAHWSQRLHPPPEILNLPTDRARPLNWSGQSSSVLLDLPLSLMARLRQCARASETSAFTWLLASYFVLLSRLSGQQDLVVGMPVKGRRDKELEGMVGFFANTVPLRFSVDMDASFSAIVGALKVVLKEALDHAEVPFAQLVQQLQLPRNAGAHPVYQTLFSFLDLRARSDQWGDLRRQGMAMPTNGGVEDLSMLVIERKEDVCLELCFNEDVFSRSTAELVARRFLTLLEGVVSHPEANVRALNFMPGDERECILRWSQSPDQEVPSNFLAQGIAQRIRTQPEAVALIDPSGQAISYGQLGQRAARIAQWLVSTGAHEGRVAMLLGQGTEAVVAILGVWAAGLAYVPLDPQHPDARLQVMLDDCGACALLSTGAHAHRLSGNQLPTLLLDSPMADGWIDAGQGLSLPSITPDDAAYVMYTSGSTGVPKGVVVSQGALANFAMAMCKEPGLTRADRVLSVTTPSFDISILELLVPLSAGAQVVVASMEQARDGHALARLLQVQGITLMQATPSSWKLLIASGWAGQTGLRALVGGEQLPADLALDLLRRVDEVWNMYGPTETTVWSSCGRLSAGSEGVHIGKPIANTAVWILDPEGALCPVGVPGEIWIGGHGLAQGYLNRPGLTALGFVNRPFMGDGFGEQRLYRTGDLGRWRPDGQLECLGRQDRQVKVRGVRIEFGEIEHHLSVHDQVAACALNVMPDASGSSRLVAYVVAESGCRLEPALLQEHLRRVLPESMVPSHFFGLDAIPFLPSGKLDHGRLHGLATALGSHGQSAPGQRTSAALVTPTQRELADIWQKLLGVSNVRGDDNFFDLGGHSLLVMQSIALMESAVGKRVNPRRYVFESLAQLAASYDDESPVFQAGGDAMPRRFSFFRRKS